MSDNLKCDNQGKRIIWVHGTKGGVGKSLMASVTVDYLLKQGEKTAIVECDGSVPDVNRRFVGVVPSLVSPLHDKDSIYDMMEAIEGIEGGIRTIVVNLPANAEVLDEIAMDVKVVTDELGYTNHTLFMVSESRDSADLAIRSMNKGLVSISDKAIVAVNQHFGSDPDMFAWYSQGFSDTWNKNGFEHMPVPELSERVKAYPDFEGSSFGNMSVKSTSKLKVIDRLLLNKWLNTCYSIVDFVV